LARPPDILVLRMDPELKALVANVMDPGMVASEQSHRGVALLGPELPIFPRPLAWPSNKQVRDHSGQAFALVHFKEERRSETVG